MQTVMWNCVPPVEETDSNGRRRIFSHNKYQCFYFNLIYVYGRQKYVFTYPIPLLTRSIQQGPSWEANRFLASQESPRIQWNSSGHYRIHKCPPPVPILSHLDPVHAPTTHFQNIHLKGIIPSTPGSFKWSPSLWSSHQKPVSASPLPYKCYTPSPCNLINLIIRTILDEE
jgi:hypothetical protein